MAAMMALLVAACQSVPAPTGFNAEQVAVLKQESFVPVDESDDWALILPNRLLFATDQSALESEKLEDIARLTRNLVRVGITNALVEGHTDDVGAADYNETLSLARAQSVSLPMIANGMPLTPEKIVGKGENFPVSSNDTEDGRQDNRRVVIIVSPN